LEWYRPLKAPVDVASDMKKAYETGKRAYAAFKKERLESTPPSKKFHDPMKKCSLKTFATVHEEITDKMQ